MAATELSDTVLHKGPCPKCGSKDNLVTYTDGHAHCFSPGCKHFVKPSMGGGAPGNTEGDHGSSGGKASAPQGLPQVTTPTEGLTKRKLVADTLRRYGYGLVDFKGSQVQAAPYYSMAGELAAMKLRLPSKDFPVLKGEGYPGRLNECQLFGRHVYGDRFDKRVVVTEGELDAMSVAQALDFKSACVSVNSGADGAAACLKANYLWLDRFDEIILWFDDDKPGREATEECAKLFKVGKVRIARAGEGRKDASDLLQANLPGDILQAVYSASAWRPKGIVNAADTPEDVVAPRDDDANHWAFDWPWSFVQDFMGPMKAGQVIYHVAGTGVGKTVALDELVDSIRLQGGKVGVMHFEDSRRDAKLHLMSITANRRLDIEPLEDAEMVALHGRVFGDRRIELFDPETAEWSVDAIFGYIRYMARALDCQVIVVDPLSFVVAGMDAAVDERRALDKVSRDKAALAKELGICIHVSHHLTRPDQGPSHEEGAATSLRQVRGSGGIANFASEVIGHERNQQAEGEDFLLTQLRSLKNRPRSRTGVMGVLEYNMETGRLLPSTKRFPGPGAGKRGDSPEFSATTEY